MGVFKRYHDLPKRTGTDRNGLSWIPKRTLRTETDSLCLQSVYTHRRFLKYGCGFWVVGCFNGPGTKVDNSYKNKKKWRPTCGEIYFVKVVEDFQGNR